MTENQKTGVENAGLEKAYTVRQRIRGRVVYRTMCLFAGNLLPTTQV